MLSELFTDMCQPHSGGIYTVAHSATVARYQVPAEWRGNLVTLVSQTADLFISFGDGNVKVGAAEVAQAIGEIISPNWGSGFVIPGGSSLTFPVALDFTHFSVVSSVASGVWTACRNSGAPTYGERFPKLSTQVDSASLWLDFGDFKSMSAAAGIASIVGREIVGIGRPIFAEATNKPALNDAIAAGAGLMRPAASFTAGSSHKLVCTDANAAGMFDGTDSFTLFIPVRRGATGALHTLFSVSTDGSANGHWDLTLDAADDVVLTRVDNAGASTSSAYATTIGTTPVLISLVYTPAAVSMYINRASVSIAGLATGNLGTASKITVGARLINTSTYSQFATAEIPEIMAFNSALSTADLATMHAWFGRRYGL